MNSPAAPTTPSRTARPTPREVLRAWPADLPLAAVVAGAPAGERWSDGRWSVLGAPSGTFRSVIAQDGSARSSWLDPRVARELPPPAPLRHDPLTDLDSLLRRHAGGDGGWIGMFAYELGALIEPRAGSRRRPPASAWPLIELHRIDAPFVHDALAGRWIGRTPGAGARAREPGPAITSADVSAGRACFGGAVRRAVEYIRAGDIFQVNLSHRVRAACPCPPRAMFDALAGRFPARHAGYVELAGGRTAVASLSPELFFAFDPADRRIVSRPMKGTRPGRSPGAELAAAAKDRAELAMIVDLMRNDLGRVCEVGSVRVACDRRIERHGSTPDRSVWQAVADVEGRVRPGLGVADILRAAFPAGSVTGAPKIRAMQIIDELEDSPRGPYCGAVGYIGDDGVAVLNVAIRTVLWRDGEPLEIPVGAGIVADSEASAEWRETLDKAAPLLDLGAPGQP